MCRQLHAAEGGTATSPHRVSCIHGAVVWSDHTPGLRTPAPAADRVGYGRARLDYHFHHGQTPRSPQRRTAAGCAPTPIRVGGGRGGAYVNHGTHRWPHPPAAGAARTHARVVGQADLLAAGV